MIMVLERGTNQSSISKVHIPTGEKILCGLVFIFSSGVFDPGLIPQLSSFKINDFVIAPCSFIGILILFNTCGPALRSINWNKLALIFIFYMFVGMSIMWSATPFSGFMRYIGLALVSFWSLYLVLRYQLDEMLKIMILIFLSIGIISAFLGVFVPHIGISYTYLEYGDWSGVYEQKNTLGRQMMLLILISTFMLINFKRDKLAMFGLIIGIILVVMSGSRTAQGLSILGVFLIIVTHFIQRPLFFSTILLGGSGVAIFFTYQILVEEIPVFLLDVETLSLMGVGLPMTGRIGIWQYAAEWIEKSPWLGYGYDGFWKLRQKLDGSGVTSVWLPDDAHNGFVDVVLQVGFAGLIFFLGVYFFFFSIAAKRSIGHASTHRERFSLFLLTFLLLANLTESYFLKATNVMQVLFNYVIISLCVSFFKPIKKVDEMRVIENKISINKVQVDHNPFFKRKP